MYELMTRRRIGRGDELNLTSVEEPFRSIVQQALTGAASLPWMVEALDAPPPRVERVPPGPPAVPSALPPIPIVEAPPPAPPPPAQPRRTPKWPWPAAAAVVLCGVIVFHQRSEREPQPASYVPPADAAAPVTAPPPPSERVVATREDPRPFWRVIAYTYYKGREAEEKAHRINQQWPEFHASVFTPRGRDRAPYLVALGGRMSKPEAARLQQKARARGLPRDTFVRNYAE
jgi:hypothetical protein